MDEEYYRGTIASIFTTIFANTINILYMKLRKQKDTKDSNIISSFVILFIIGNTLGYCLDMIFAKRSFNDIEISYDDYNTRLSKLLTSFISIQFVKFFLIVILDMIIIHTIFKVIEEQLDKHKINFNYRNEIIISVISLLTFVTYVNLLRFNWVYKQGMNPWMDMTMYAWIFITIIIFLSNRNTKNTKNTKIL